MCRVLSYWQLPTGRCTYRGAECCKDRGREGRLTDSGSHILMMRLSAEIILSWPSPCLLRCQSML